jgi:signal transduction histidine kinase
MSDTVLTVWVVEDEAAMRSAVARALDEHHVIVSEEDSPVRFSVTSMESGEEFLEKSATAVPDILLLDGKLPGIDGMEVLRIIEQRKMPVVTIMITAYATLQGAVAATKLGTFDFLAKPFTPAELRLTVGKAARDIILTRKARLLEQQQRGVRFEFLSILAHELKSPIGAVEGYVELMKNRVAGSSLDAYDEMLGRMSARIYGMRKLIADLLDLTWLESGKKAREFENVDICEAVNHIIDNNAAQASAMGVTCTVSCDGNCVVKAVRGEIDVLINNLITNAIKYNVRNGKVTVDIASSNGLLSIRVADTGIGIKPEDKHRLFKEFSRIKTSATRHIEGSGLGLSIIHKITALYKGTVDVESCEHNGSVFIVKLPVNPI